MNNSSDLKRSAFVLGASGLIGSAIAARLNADGWTVVALVRTDGADARRLSVNQIVFGDMRTLLRAEDWAPYLQKIDLVINCAGNLQDGARDSTSAVHDEAPRALFEACEQAAVRRIIHFSAIGVSEEALSKFSETKAAAEAALRRCPLDWVILRPSVVVGRAAYGGSALFRGLAALPWLPRLDTGDISVVQLDDVVETVARLVQDDAPSRLVLDLAGPEALAFESVIGRYRAWFGWRRAAILRVPAFLMSALYRLGDVAGWLGWRPPIRTTARREMVRGAVGDPTAWKRVTGINPLSLDEALAREPASVQERWFAQLYLLKPVVIIVFAAFWFLTAFISLGPGYAIGHAMMIEGGAGTFSGPIVVAGALADFAIGAAILWRRTTRHALWAAIALTLAYLIIGSTILPRLWNDPLGPMMKVWPVLALNFAALAILDER